MDEQDKEFEAFLRRFHLRNHPPFPAENAAKVRPRRWATRWMLAAAATAVVLVLALPFVWQLTAVLPSMAVVESAGDSGYKVGDTLTEGTIIRSGGTEGLLLRLEDGSRVEMRAQSQIILEKPEEQATSIRLNTGSLVVRTASRREGNLFVRTDDTLVAHAGALFLVETLENGSRVAALEGEAEVHIGSDAKTLGAGQQIASNSEIEEVALRVLIAWSREAAIERSRLVAGHAAATAEREPVHVVTPQDAPPPPPPPPPPTPEQQQQQPDTGANNPGRDIFYRNCVSCHSDEIVKNRRWTSREAIANRIPTDLQYGARLSPQEVQLLIDYIWVTWGTKP